MPDNSIFRKDNYGMSLTAEIPASLDVSVNPGAATGLVAHLKARNALLEEQMVEHADLADDCASVLKIAERLKAENDDLRRMCDVEPAPGMAAQVIHLTYPAHLTDEQRTELLTTIGEAADKAVTKYSVDGAR